MPELKVVPIGTPNLNDIPGMLEATAKDVRAGGYGDVGQAVLVMTVGVAGNREALVFDFGTADGNGTRLSALGLLVAGQFKIMGAANG